MTPYAGSVRPLGAETTRRSYGSQTAYRPRPPFGATRGRKLQCLRRQLLSSEVDGPRAQTLLDAQASAGPATHGARHGTVPYARRGAAAGSRAGHRAAAACGGAREARRRLGAQRAPPPRRRRGLDAEPRQQDVRAGAPGRLGARQRDRRRPDHEPTHQAAERSADERAQPALPARENLKDAAGERDPAEDQPPVVVARQDGGHGLARDRAVEGAEDARRDAERDEGHDPEPAGDRDHGEAPDDSHAERSIGEAWERVKLTRPDHGGS